VRVFSKLGTNTIVGQNSSGKSAAMLMVDRPGMMMYVVSLLGIGLGANLLVGIFAV
jgi:hypothetical protein